MDTPFDLDQTDRLLSTTRTVRYRLDLEKPVPRDLILDCIRLSQQAPTASNTQRWRWVVVSDPGLRAEIAGIYAELAARSLPWARKRFASDAQTERVYDAAGWLAEHLAEVPVLAVPCLAERLPEDAPHLLAASHYGSIFPAIWSFQLALRSRGLGSALTTLHLQREAEVASILGIPDDVTQAGLLPVAWTRGTEFKPARRPPVETVVSWERWGNG